MENHELACDCARCVPTQELLEQHITIGQWTTKIELFLLRKCQETRILCTLQNASEIPGLNFKFGFDAKRYEIKERTEVNAALLGILERKVNGTSVFSILEFQIVLAAWKVHARHRPVTSLWEPAPDLWSSAPTLWSPAPALWSSFLIQAMREYTTVGFRDAYRDAIAELIHCRGPRVLSPDVIVHMLLKHKVPTAMETMFKIHPQGTFRSKFGHTIFYSQANQLLPQDDLRVIIKEEDDGPSAPIGKEKTDPSSCPSSSFAGYDNDRRSDTVETEYHSPKRPYDEEDDVGYKRFRKNDKEQTLNNAPLKVEIAALRARLNSLERSVRGRPSLMPSTQPDLSTELRSHFETDIARVEARQDALINAVNDLTRKFRE
ncbi:hypothetical protein N7520_003532 [Penicillium odoratum]|uniref:uncharacterized protein n=1 Tax=Penicillium odoratum TaxID=1167516 RepID=UPI00254745DF|nr:uncharacterized protein N7520_003532 [Penicillium odoratum]KAJ5768973.1 hypothetical protein N7520_003532 [Penicillium odoratum]